MTTIYDIVRSCYLQYQRDNLIVTDLYNSIKKELVESNNFELSAFCDFVVAMHYLKEKEWDRYDELYEEINALTNSSRFYLLYSTILKSMSYLFIKNDVEKSIKYMLRSRDMLLSWRSDDTFSIINFPFIYFQILYLLGMLYYYKGDLSKASMYSKRALRQKLDKEDYFLKIKPYKWLGLIENSCGNPMGAIKYFEACEKLYNKFHIISDYADILNSWGLIYYKYGRSDLAIKSFSQSLQLSEKGKFYNIMADALNNIGIAYFQINEYEKALTCYKRSIECRCVYPHSPSVAITDCNLGEVYQSMGQLDLSLEYYQNAMEKAKKLRMEPNFLMEIHCSLADVYLDRDDIKNAFLHLKKAEKINMKTNDKEMAQRIYSLHSKYYKHTKYFKKALDYAEKANKLRDEIASQEKEMMLKLK